MRRVLRSGIASLLEEKNYRVEMRYDSSRQCELRRDIRTPLVSVEISAWEKGKKEQVWCEKLPQNFSLYLCSQHVP
jgi:hypothetical protein